MFNDMKSRHTLEAKTTSGFLKFALGSRSAVPAPNLVFEKSILNHSSIGERSTYENTSVSVQLPSVSRKLSKQNKETPFKRPLNSEQTVKKERSLQYESTKSQIIKLPHLMGKKDRARNREFREKP